MNICIVGGSSGIGLGVARAIVERGDAVTIVGRSRDKLDATKASLGAHVTTVMADVTSEVDVQRILAPPFDHIVSTAVTPYYAPARELDMDRVREVVASKLLSAMLLAKYARLPAHGSIVLTSGIASLRPGPGASAIASVNGALDALVRVLALELAPARVNAISPGWVDTPIWSAMLGDAKADTLDAHGKRLPVGRVGTPADLARATLFLIDNGFTTGQTLHVDGGHQLI